MMARNLQMNVRAIIQKEVIKIGSKNSSHPLQTGHLNNRAI
jgi:hypothetical protein